MFNSVENLFLDVIRKLGKERMNERISYWVFGCTVQPQKGYHGIVRVMAIKGLWIFSWNIEVKIKDFIYIAVHQGFKKQDAV